MSNFNLSRLGARAQELCRLPDAGHRARRHACNIYKLGREEDPPFTIKTMVVKTLWPGATTLETVQQVTERIEKKLEELPNLDYLKSYSKPGESVVFVNLKDTTRAVRRARSLVSGAQEGWRHQADACRTGCRGRSSTTSSATPTRSSLRSPATVSHTASCATMPSACAPSCSACPTSPKIDLLGTQDEKIYLEFSTQQLAAMGLDVSQLLQTLQAQNAIQPSGTVDAGRRENRDPRLGPVHLGGEPEGLNFRVNGRFFRLSDIANVRRGYVDPQQPLFRYNGTPAIGLAISMTKNADVLAFGEHIKERLAKVTADSPSASRSHLVADQPEVVEEAVGEFIKTLIEAIAIVLGVSFLSLGWRPGIVVAIAIPLVLAITFVVMKLAGISLQRISLGALIIGLGLLVDDAMIAVETMISKLDHGVVNQKSEPDDERTQRDALQADAGQFHDHECDGKHQWNCNRHHDAGAPAERQEAHPKHDGDGLDQRLDELADGFLDDLWLVATKCASMPTGKSAVIPARRSFMCSPNARTSAFFVIEMASPTAGTPLYRNIGCCGST